MKTLLAGLALIPGICFGADSCKEQIPTPVAQAILKAFPKFRLPLESDNSPDDVAWKKKADGHPCFGVASADFNGDTERDFILGLTAKKGEGGLVIAALSGKHAWKVEKLSDWPESRLRLFVGKAPAGTFTQTEALEGNPPPLVCSTSVAVYGGIEAWSVVMCWKRGKWKSIQTSD